MKSLRGWFVVTSVLFLGICFAVYPTLQNSLQLTAQENRKSQSPEVNSAQAESVETKLKKLTPAEQVYAKVSPAVVTVYGANGVGSGMVLRSRGLVLTNKHIVDNVATVQVKTTIGEVYEGTVVDFDLQYDLALVELKHATLNLPTVTLADAVPLKPGDAVYAIGSPGGKAGTLTTGTFTRTTPHGSLQISAGLLNPGNSGGPLLNSQGMAIGVNKGLLQDKSGLATPIAAAKTLLTRYETINKSVNR